MKSQVRHDTGLEKVSEGGDRRDPRDEKNRCTDGTKVWSVRGWTVSKIPFSPG